METPENSWNEKVKIAAQAIPLIFVTCLTPLNKNAAVGKKCLQYPEIVDNNRRTLLLRVLQSLNVNVHNSEPSLTLKFTRLPITMRSLALTLLCLVPTGFPVYSAEQFPADKSISEAIDYFVDAKIKRLGASVADQADDFTLIRRLTLDLVGRIPTPAETKAYVESTDPQKREKLVDRLMASPSFIRHQATMLDLAINPPLPGSNRGNGTKAYLQQALADNKSWDQIFRDLMQPDENNPKLKGSSEFLRNRINDLDRTTNDVSVAFFGVNVSCAQCHDHPLVSDWKQDHFYGMKSFFARSFDSGGILAEKSWAVVKFKPTKGPERQAKMMFLTGEPIDAPGQKELSKEEEKKEKELLEELKKQKKTPPPPAFSARAKLVEVALAQPEGGFFSKAIVNRLWYQFTGQGFVSPLDQMHSENEPSHPELLSWLARDMAANKYDLRRMIRGMVLSKTYSRSSKIITDKIPNSSLFAYAKVRPLTPWQLATSLRIALTDPAQFEGKPEEVAKRIEGIEQSSGGLAAAIAIPTPDNFAIGVNEALLFSNNPRYAGELLADSPDRVLGKIKNDTDAGLASATLVRSILSREAHPDEIKAFKEYAERRTDRRPEAYKQIAWALMTSPEFRFNH